MRSLILTLTLLRVGYALNAYCGSAGVTIKVAVVRQANTDLRKAFAPYLQTRPATN